MRKFSYSNPLWVVLGKKDKREALLRVYLGLITNFGSAWGKDIELHTSIYSNEITIILTI